MRFVPFYLLAAVVILSSLSCSQGEDNRVTNGYLPIEVDMQFGQDPFGGPESNVENIFPGSAKPRFYVDNDGLEDTMIEFVRAAQYASEHRVKVTTGNDVWYSVYTYYLCGITQFMDEAGPINYRAGNSSLYANLYEGYSFVCKAVTDLQPSSIRDDLRLKICCEELGHQIGELKHNCIQADIFDAANHSDTTCLMGQGLTSICRNADLLEYIHFCDYCKQNLGNAKGRVVPE